MRSISALILLSLAFAACSGAVWAFSSAAVPPNAYQAESKTLGQQQATISNTIATGSSPVTASLTAIANCGAQGKFYYPPKASCCAVSDTSPNCTEQLPVTPGSQDFTSAGTYSFTVPPYNTLTVTILGAGGGGGGSGFASRGICGFGSSGGAGGTSSFGSIVAYGGGGGGAGSTSPSNGSSGSASGGDSNTPGGGAAGGSGGSFYSCRGGSGGYGGRAGKTWASASGPSAGATFTVTVGGGGGGGSTSTAGNAGAGGSTGRVSISWQ